AIMGDGPIPSYKQVTPFPGTSHTPMPAGLIVPPSAYKEPDLSKGLIIGQGDHGVAYDPKTAKFYPTKTEVIEEAPPNAYVRNPDAPILTESPEETEKKKALLHGAILRAMPATMKLRLPNLEHDLDLKLAVIPSPAGMNFVRVRYGQHQGEEDAPQVELYTSDPDFNADALKAEIVKQAEMRYRQARPALAPRTVPSQGFPDPNMIQIQRGGANGTDDVVPREDVESWERAVGRKIGSNV
ncbi:MAG TPA: hypothetical protein VNH83_26875, partial [Bryobacteraceae bacterium]|nr:hypothetical protein [Bryobacteraceae bacterium]